MPNDTLHLSPSDVTFVRKLKQGERSTIFQVIVRGKECVMKVVSEEQLYLFPIEAAKYAEPYVQFRIIPESDAETPLIEHSIFFCERTAYRRLKEKGLYDKGVVPQFFGTIEHLQPTLWKPHLDMFLRHKLLPNATLIEYIPRMQMIDLPTFSTPRLDNLVSILKEIHRAKVLHRDPYPRNMMIVPSNPDRVLWIDFDQAQTYFKSLTARQKEWFEDEDDLMREFVEGLVSHMMKHWRALSDQSISCLQQEDTKEGKHRKTFHFYFDGMSQDFCEKTFGSVAGKR